MRIFFLVLLFVTSACQRPAQEETLQPGTALGGQAERGFARATSPRDFVFPQDHGAHPDYRNEWWYVTGNLEDAEGRRYGYQVTLFRIALAPHTPVSSSAWATNQVWMAHVALTDVSRQQHWSAQRLARGAMGLAGQSDFPFRVWVEDWQIHAHEKAAFPWSIEVVGPDFSLALEITPTKPVVLQGEQGLSQKSDKPGNASYYYSLTRMQTHGHILSNGQTRSVAGLSWLDREWSTSALGEGQSGWDWFSLQLRDGHDLMFYRLRRKDGRADVNSKGAWVDPEGEKRTLLAGEVQLRALRYWHADNGARYPIAWSMQIPKLERFFIVEPLVEDQLMRVNVVYWEGAVRVRDANSDEIVGYGYLELAGY